MCSFFANSCACSFDAHESYVIPGRFIFGVLPRPLLTSQYVTENEKKLTFQVMCVYIMTFSYWIFTSYCLPYLTHRTFASRIRDKITSYSRYCFSNKYFTFPNCRCVLPVLVAFLVRSWVSNDFFSPA